MTEGKTAFISLGSNLGDAYANVLSAVEALRQHPSIDIVQCSPWYGSHAVGPGEQEKYVNGVVELRVNLTPIGLLHALQAIERAHHRERSVRWGPRTLDLDVLVYEDVNINTTELTLPHPRILERNFVLLPLRDIAPQMRLTKALSVQDAAENISSQGAWKMLPTSKQF